MEENKPKLWEEDWTKEYKPKKLRFRSATLHYLGLLVAIAGFIIIIMGLFDPDASVYVIRPGEDAYIWDTVFLGLAMLLGGGAIFLIIEE